MVSGKNSNSINGWLVLDKPKGLTSAAALNQVKRILKPKKAGHGGTLDPLATGVLPLAFGEATKVMAYILDEIKEYEFTVRWGESRDTDDADGRVTSISGKRPSMEEITKALPKFIGNVKQVPPDFSAVKVLGKRAYSLARSNKPLNLQPKTIYIESFELKDIPDRDHAVFQVISGKGAYMRGLARDLAYSLGTLGHVVQLRRRRIGPFREDVSISLDNLGELGHTAPVESFIRPVEAVLDDIPVLALTEDEVRRIRNGQRLPVQSLADQKCCVSLIEDSIVLAADSRGPVALTRFIGGEICPFRVFNIF